MTHSTTLGIDLGSESIGWALVRDADPPHSPEIIATGVSIFNSGRNEKGESLAQDRRIKRGQRRRRARYLWRRDRLMRALIRMNLMPQEKEDRKKLEQLDPYEWRAKAAQQKIAAHELGRALFHLNQRRGFQSNRKSEKKADRNAYKKGLEALKDALGDKTLGEYLWKRHNVTQDIHKKPGILFRSVQNGAKTEYLLYPTRDMYKAEFSKIQETQGNSQGLQPEQWEELWQIIFEQRDLKPVEVGSCSLYYGQDIINPVTGEITKAPKEDRAPLALPSAQMFRVVQDINNMEIRDENRRWRKLTPDEREKLWILFNTQKKIEFKAVRKKLDWPEDAEINLENDRRTYLKGNETVCTLARYFGKDFYKQPVAELDDIAQFILDCEHAEDLFNEAVTSWKIPEEKARRLVFEDETSAEDFTAGYGRFSAKAYRDMIPLMRVEQLRYDEATARLGIHHSDRGADGSANTLPLFIILAEGILRSSQNKFYPRHSQLPLYRQSGIYARDGVEIDRSTMAEWVGQMAFLFDPLAQSIARHVRGGAAIHADDTPVPVLDPGRGKTRTGRLWVAVRDERPWGSCVPPAAFYLYAPDRKAARAEALLGECRGFLHADAYAGFNSLYEPVSSKARLVEVACWAHARRQIFDVHADTASPAAYLLLQKIGELFTIEADISRRPPEERLAVRTARSVPLLAVLKGEFEAARGKVSEKSSFAKALRYALTRWGALARYTTDGRLDICNNAAERAIRPLALGRKNWLFAGSDSGGERAAKMYTLIETAKMNDIDPEA